MQFRDPRTKWQFAPGRRLVFEELESRNLLAVMRIVDWNTLNGPNEFTVVGSIRNWDRRRDLKAITQKTLITTGEFDEITLDCHMTLRDGIAGPARLAVMAGCSHLTMNEKPEEYNALLRAFMNEA